MATGKERRAKGTIYVGNHEAAAALEIARRAVARLDGIFEVEADHISRLLIIEYDQDKVTLEELEKVAEQARAKATRRAISRRSRTPK